MNERDHSLTPWILAVLLIITLFGIAKVTNSEIRDLQRRVGQLEEQVKR